MTLTLTAEQEATLDLLVSRGDYPSKQAALEEAFRRFQKMLDTESAQRAINKTLSIPTNPS